MKKFERPVEEQDLKSYPSIGPGPYNFEELRWCDATYDFLWASWMTKAAQSAAFLGTPCAPPQGVRKRHKRHKRRRWRPAAAQAPAADQNLETEDDDTQPLRRQRNPKRRRSARWAIVFNEIKVLNIFCIFDIVYIYSIFNILDILNIFDILDIYDIYMYIFVYLTYFVYIFSIPSGGGRTPSKAVDDEDPAPLLSPLLSPDSGK
jgi:hypothetical protein